MQSRLAQWYQLAGRHDLPWRDEHDPWLILFSEVLLHQTQAPRIAAVWPRFRKKYSTPAALVDLGLAELLRDWQRLGYPRRARALFECARHIESVGWPDDLTDLPGIGPYTAGAIRIQAFDEPLIAADTNIRRVLTRYRGDRQTDDLATVRAITRNMRPRDRFLAVMDLGALRCTATQPNCAGCPLYRGCATRGRHPSEQTRRVAPYRGSLRQRRGAILQALRAGERLTSSGCQGQALESLLRDGLVRVDGNHITLP